MPYFGSLTKTPFFIGVLCNLCSLDLLTFRDYSPYFSGSVMLLYHRTNETEIQLQAKCVHNIFKTITVFEWYNNRNFPNVLHRSLPKVWINYLLILSQRGPLSSGRVLGGSSSLNYMHHIRGSRHDFDAWEKEGATGWSYKDVLPYFIKSEDVQIPELKDSRKKKIV